MQPAIQGGSRSVDPNLDLAAMKSAHSAAISSNEKIFPIFAKKLASRDSKDFINTAHKLAVWLGSEKAYYPAARPKIVELLEIALSTFMDAFMQHSAVVELAECLRQLVQAVMAFRHLFPERELQSRLQRVVLDAKLSFSRLSASTTHGSALPQGSVAATGSLPTFASFYPQPTMPSVLVPQRSTGQIQSSPSVVKPTPDGFVHDDVSRARDPSGASSSGQTKAILSLASPVTKTPQDLGETISPTIPSKPQPRRAQRAKLSEELVARDLDWFKSNRGITVVNEDPTPSSSKGSDSSQVLGSDTSHTLRRSPLLKKKTARMVPSRRLPSRITFDTAQEVESGASSSLPLSELTAEKVEFFENPEDVSIQMDVDGQSLSMERTNSTTIPEDRDALTQKGLPVPEPQLVPTSPNEPSTEPKISQTDESLSAEAPLLNGESRISACPSALRLDTMLDGMESMAMFTSDLGSESLPSEPASELEPISPWQMLQLRSPILPPLVNALEPPLNLQFRIARRSPTQPQQSGMDANQRRFDGEMNIIHSIQGKPFTHTHTIDISLNESIFSKISKWVHRKHRPSEASQGVCISLACYRLPEFFDRIKSESGKHGIQELTTRSPCSWPTSNRLSFSNKERQTIITLSPPLFLTPDQCVDISSLIKSGSNTLEIRQKGDLSEYLVVFHAHPPTRAQLAQLDVVKTDDERWKRFLDVLSARAAPGKMLGTVSAGVVGVS